MDGIVTIEDRIKREYSGLSEKLREAADFVLNNPIDSATRPLRSLAATSGVSPAAFSRLARALGYSDYEEMREDGRTSMGRKMQTFSERAEASRTSKSPKDATHYLHLQAQASIRNIEYLERDTTREALGGAVDKLHEAQNVLLVGSQGSAGILDYFGYLTQWFRPHWLVAGRNGTMLGTSMARLTEGDAVIAVTMSPYSRRTISALKVAHERGVPTIAITDSVGSPAVEYSQISFVVPTESPLFFSSYTAAIVLIETMVTMLLARTGQRAEEMIRAAETQIHNLEETWGHENRATT